MEINEKRSLSNELSGTLVPLFERKKRKRRAGKNGVACFADPEYRQYVRAFADRVCGCDAVVGIFVFSCVFPQDLQAAGGKPTLLQIVPTDQELFCVETEQAPRPKNARLQEMPEMQKSVALAKSFGEARGSVPLLSTPL